jgi:GntR family transcriptional repressor for pyruvate dehydrogenase complex
MAFEKINQGKFQKKSSIIADQILERIKSGEYSAGSKLPSERMIAEQMGVSRPSLREAISALHIVGILESRPGDGSYVSAIPASEDPISQALSVLEQSDSPFEVLQARKAFEVGVAKLAVEVADDEDIKTIKKRWNEKYEKGRRGDYVAYTRYGKEFHLAIARATRNRLIIAVMDKLLNVTNQPLWVSMRQAYYEADPARIEEMLEVHNDIVTAIQERDSDKAIRSLEKDFDNVLEQLYSLREDGGKQGYL